MMENDAPEREPPRPQAANDNDGTSANNGAESTLARPIPPPKNPGAGTATTRN